LPSARRSSGRGTQRSHVLYGCNGLAGAPARSGSPPRLARSRTRNRRERHAGGLVVSVFPSCGGEPPGPADHLGSTNRAKRCTCIDATNLYSPEHAADQCREVRTYGVPRTSPHSSDYKQQRRYATWHIPLVASSCYSGYVVWSDCTGTPQLPVEGANTERKGSAPRRQVRNESALPAVGWGRALLSRDPLFFATDDCPTRL
jgi:hypothetical protein